jgi:hypothetical protein
MVAIFWLLMGAVLMGWYNALLLLDDKTLKTEEMNKEIEEYWYGVGAGIFFYLSLTTIFIWGMEYVPFTLSSFWLLFAGIVHNIGLNKPFFFVGTTAKTDILLRIIYPKNPELASAILKFTLFFLSLLLLFF